MRTRMHPDHRRIEVSMRQGGSYLRDRAHSRCVSLVGQCSVMAVRERQNMLCSMLTMNLTGVAVVARVEHDGRRCRVQAARRSAARAIREGRRRREATVYRTLALARFPRLRPPPTTLYSTTCGGGIAKWLRRRSANLKWTIEGPRPRTYIGTSNYLAPQEVTASWGVVFRRAIRSI